MWGASIFEVLEPLRRTLASLGTTIEDELDLILCDPSFTAILRDRLQLTFPAPSTAGSTEALLVIYG